MSVGIYAVGLLFLITGVTYLGYLNHLSGTYILAGVFVTLCVAVVTAMQTSRRSRI